MSFLLVMNFRMPIIVGVLKFITRTNRNNSWHFKIYFKSLFHAHAVRHEKKFITRTSR